MRYTTVAYPTSGYHVLRADYYDNYEIPVAPVTFSTAIGDAYYDNSTHKPKGMLTSSWIRASTTSTSYTKQLKWYLFDYKARVLEEKTYNYLMGTSKKHFKWDFTKLLYTMSYDRRLMPNPDVYTKETFTYTNQDRLLTHTHQIGLTGTPQLMAKNEYDELGNLISKKTGGTSITAATYYQKTDYTYNIRGWLKGINDIDHPTIDPTDLFAYKLTYNTTESTETGATPLYNGNISGTYWRTGNDGILRQYGYQYDELNRLTEAVYHRDDTHIVHADSYHEDTSYDANGNIQSMHRNGELDDSVTEIQIDDLSYTYDTNVKNRLLKVNDEEHDSRGFNDGANTGNDYTYDDYGSLKTDENKGITDITYNHLNQPVKITFGTTGSIEYAYYTSGEKYRKIVINGSTTTTTEYLSGFQYTNTVLDFFPTAQGYVKNTVISGNNNYNYVFNFTDQLGNVRLSYAKDPGSGSLMILGENNYYPFGLKHGNYNGGLNDFQENSSHAVELSNAANASFKYRVNGAESQEELGLNMYDMPFRDYDAAIGRWVVIDPVTHHSQSPYSAFDNNPVFWADPSGSTTTSVDYFDLFNAAGSNGITTYHFDNGVLTSAEFEDPESPTSDRQEEYSDLSGGGGGGGSSSGNVGPGPQGIIIFTNLTPQQLSDFLIIPENLNPNNNPMFAPTENNVEYRGDGLYFKNFTQDKYWYKVSEGGSVTITYGNGLYHYSGQESAVWKAAATLAGEYYHVGLEPKIAKHWADNPFDTTD